jgi:hypothetical protein
MTNYCDSHYHLKTPILKLNLQKLNFYEKSKKINANRCTKSIKLIFDDLGRTKLVQRGAVFGFIKKLSFTQTKCGFGFGLLKWVANFTLTFL